jgi:hypothetical protein
MIFQKGKKKKNYYKYYHYNFETSLFKKPLQKKFINSQRIGKISKKKKNFNLS